MKPVIKKALQFFCYLLCALLFLVIALIFSLNTTFVQNILTQKINSYFQSKGWGITVEHVAISTSGNIEINNLLVLDKSSDSIVFISNLNIDFKWRPLLHQSLVVENFSMKKVEGKIISDAEGNLNIVKIFSQQNSATSNESKSDSKWEVCLNKSKLADVKFQYIDSLNNIFLNQYVKELDVDFKSFSLLNEKIEIAECIIQQPHGSFSYGESEIQTHTDDTENSKWQFSAEKILVDEWQYSIYNLNSNEQIQTFIQKFEFEVKNIDLPSQRLLISKAIFENPQIDYETGNQLASTDQTKAARSENKSNWNLQCNLFNVKDGGFNFTSSDSAVSPWFPIQTINTTIENFILDSLKTLINIPQFSCSLNNNLLIHSASVSAEANNQMIGNIRLKMLGSTVKNSQGPFYANDSITLIASLNGNPDDFRIRDAKIDFASGPTLTFDSELKNIIAFPNSQYKLNFVSNAISSKQIEKLTQLVNAKVQLPGIESVTLTGNLEGTDKNEPNINLRANSSVGFADVKAKINLRNYNSSVEANFSKLNLSKLLDESLPEQLSASVKWNGVVRSANDINGSGTVNVTNYDYKNISGESINADFIVQQNICEFKLHANDSILKANLSGNISWNNPGIEGKVAGEINLNEKKSELIPGNINLESELNISLSSLGDELLVDINLNDMKLSNLEHSSSIEKLDAKLIMDDQHITSTVNTDFLSINFSANSNLENFLKSFDAIDFKKAVELDTSGFLNFVKLSKIPQFEAALKLNYNPVFEFLYTDSVFKFGTITSEIYKKHKSDSVYLQLDIDSVQYFGYRILDPQVTISAKENSLSAVTKIAHFEQSDKVIGSAELKMTMLPEGTSFDVLVNDTSELPLYKLNLDAVKNSDRFILSSETPEWIINSDKWNLTNTEFLTWKFRDKDIFADLNLSHDSMQVSLTGSKNSALNLNLANIKIHEIFANNIGANIPDGLLNASVSYNETEGQKVALNLDIKKFDWENVYLERVSSSGEFFFDSTGVSSGKLTTLINDTSRIEVALLNAPPTNTDVVDVKFHSLPVSLIEPFTDNLVDSLKGYVSGHLRIDQMDNKNVLTGAIGINNVSTRVVSLGTMFVIPHDTLFIAESKMKFNKFLVLDSLNKQMVIDGNIDFENTEKIIADLKVKINDVQVMSTTMEENNDFFGKIIVTSGLTITGPIINPTIIGNVTLQEGTNVTYRQTNAGAIKNNQNIVTFAELNGDSVQMEVPLSNLMEVSGLPQIQTTIAINPKSVFNIEVAGSYSIHIGISGSGLLNYSMLPNNSISLTGNYEINNGTAELKFAGWPLKDFLISQGSRMRWDGNVEDPDLNIEATSKVRGSYVNPVDNKVRYVDFVVSMKLQDQVSKMKLLFDVKCNDQYMSSVLSSLSEDELMKQAVNLLIFESINLPNMQSSSNYLASQMNSFWESQLNALSKTSFKKIDLSFGIDSYTQTSASGGSEEKTSLTYSLERKILHDRGSIKLSGRFNDGSDGPNQSNSMLENLIFEYQLDSLERKFLKLYTKRDYDDILDGEVTKSGIGFVYRKTYPDFRSIWRRENKLKQNFESTLPGTN